MKKRLLTLFLALAMLLSLMPTLGLAAETAPAGTGETEDAAKTVTVYLSISHDEEFVKGPASGKVMALQEVEVPYFDLGLYGLSNYYFSSESYGSAGNYDGTGSPSSDLIAGTPDFAKDKITMLHLFIYATEVYYLGVDPEDAGKGALKDMIGTEANIFNISGSVGSSFLDYIWGMDYNLNYYRNYAYPLASVGWGSTSDQILLREGDVITLGHFDNINFFKDPSSVFNYIKAGDKTVNATVTKGEKVSMTVYRAGANMGAPGSGAGSGDYSTAQTPVTSQPEVYCVPVNSLSSGNVTDTTAGWTQIAKADANGAFTVDTTDMPAGKYLICVAGQYGSEQTEKICSAPGGIILTVTEETIPTIAVESVSLDQTALELEVGNTAVLKAAVLPENATDKAVAWTSSDPEVATVSDGTVTAVKAGTAVITATAGEKTATCTVTVEEAVTVPVLKEGVEATRSETVKTGSGYQLEDLMAGKIFEDPAGTALNYSNYFYQRSADGGKTWGEMTGFTLMEHGTVNSTLVETTPGTYIYKFWAKNASGMSEDTWTLTLTVSDRVQEQVKFYLGQDHNYKTNGNIMPVLELYKTAGLDEDLYDYVGWFTNAEGQTEYIYDPHAYTIIDGETDYVTVNGVNYELHDYEKVTFTNSAFDDADSAAMPSGTVENKYNMFYAELWSDRYSTRVYGYNATTSAYDVYLGGQSMELPMEKDIYGNGGNDIYLRQVDVYTTSKKLDNTYFTADDYYAEVIMPITGGMIHAGDPYVSGNYTKFPFFSWAAGNGSLYNAYVYPYDTENYIFSQQINLTTPKGTSVVAKTISISTVLRLTVTVPETADFELYFQYNNFNTKEMAPEGEAVVNGDGTKTLSFKVSKNSQNYTWRLTDTTGKYVTRAGWLAGITAATAKTYTFDETSPTDKKTHSFRGLGTAVGTRDEADLQVFMSASGFKSTTETTRIRAYRMWEIINSDPGNIMIEPDFHIQVLQGNASDISLVSGGNVKNNWIDVTPTTTDIVAVTYDALEVLTTADVYGSHGGLFPATNPERTNVFIITNETAGTAAAHIPFNGSKETDRGTEWDYNYDTWSYLNSDTAPKLDFTVTGTGTVDVSYATVITNDALKSTLSGWTGLTAEDGTYYVDLLPFRTAGTKGGTVIIKMTDSTGTSYALVRVAEMTATVTNVTTPGEPFTPGDQVSITFDGLYRSINKISGIFNPTTYYLRYTAGDVETNGSLAQYQQMDKASISLTIPEDLEFPEGQTSMEYNFTNGYVYGSMYAAASPFQSMYYITDTGVGTNFSAVGVSFVLSRLADIPITVEQKNFYDMKLAFSDGEKPITNVTVSITDPNGNVLTPDENGIYQDLAYGDYHMDIAAPGYRRNMAPLHLGAADAAAVVDGILTKTIILEKGGEGCWDGTAVSEPKTDENGVYLIGTGAELAWFAQTVNAGTNGISGILTADIDLGNYNWTPIGTDKKAFTGNLDGQNHKITGLYLHSTTGATYQGLFGSTGSSTTISNLTVEGAIYATGPSNVSQAKIGGVAGSASGTTFTNVHANVDITIDRVKGSWANVGGISGYGGKFTNCSNSGDISGYNNVGGISGSSASSFTGCFNSGNISGNQYLGGITGSSCYGAIISCYNTGDVTGKSSYVAGIVGEHSRVVTNCFNTGTISIAGNTGAIIGRVGNGNVAITDNYYLQYSHSAGFGGGTQPHQVATMVTADTMAAADFVTAMNNGLETPAFKQGVKHPILIWQAAVAAPESEAVVVQGAEQVVMGQSYSFTVQLSAGYYAANMVVKVNGQVVEADENGVYTIPAVTENLVITVEGVTDSFDVTVSGGTGSGTYKVGETVTIMAERKPGFRFKQWTSSSDEVVFADAFRTGTTFVMPAEAVTVTANYEVDWVLVNTLAAGALTEVPVFPFSDVPATAWYYDEVKEAWENGLIDGMTADRYQPDATLTVAQAVKLAAALHQMYFEGEVTLTNGATNWYDTYVDYAVANGIIEAKYDGYTAAQMNASISRKEFVHIFHGAMPGNYYACNTVADNAIPDVKMGGKNAAEIYEFYRAGILTGSDAAGTFHPDNSIKRSEVAAILIRMYDVSARQAVTLK